MLKTCLIYCRSGSDTSRSITEKRNSCIDYALNNGYVVTKIFTDEMVEGNTLGRFGLLNLLAHLTDKKRNPTDIESKTVVVVNSVSCLATGFERFHLLIKLLEELNASLEVVEGGDWSVKNFEKIMNQMEGAYERYKARKQG